MVAGYDVEGGSLRAEKPRLWSEPQVSGSGFDLHPDGQRFAVLRVPEAAEARQDRLVLILNFFDYLRRIAPAEKAR